MPSVLTPHPGAEPSRLGTCSLQGGDLQLRPHWKPATESQADLFQVQTGAVPPWAGLLTNQGLSLCVCEGGCHLIVLV